MRDYPCTYASQPEEHRQRAVDSLRVFTQSHAAAGVQRLTKIQCETLLEGIWTSDLKIGNIICQLQASIPMRLPCPDCGELHVDEGEFATKPHHTHACQHCGMVWRPALVDTVGVMFLPGFRNEKE